MEHENPVLLAVSFGTSYAKTRELTIEATEKALQAAFPGFELRRAFTSPTIIRKLRQRDGIVVDSLHDALQQLADEGVAQVLVQPTHMMPGYEYDDLRAEAQSFRGEFSRLWIGRPLLQTDLDCRELTQILLKKTAQFDRPDTAVVWMGHGSEHPGNAIYTAMQKALASAGAQRHLVGTVEGTPDLEDMIRSARALGVSRVVLQPLMIVAGEHATHDMAGGEPDSWKSRFEAAGFEVHCVFDGVGQYPEVQEMIVRHARQTLEEQ